jgi:hypothetical protein
MAIFHSYVKLPDGNWNSSSLFGLQDGQTPGKVPRFRQNFQSRQWPNPLRKSSNAGHWENQFSSMSTIAE